MKLSESSFKVMVVFIDSSNNLVHSIGFEEQPNVATLLENFDEVENDPEFGIGKDAKLLKVDIVPIEYYIEAIGDIELEV